MRGYPESQFASSALSTLASLHRTAGELEQAVEAYKRLSETYPTSVAWNKARFAMVKCLVDMGRMAWAKQIVRQMVDSIGTYPVDQLVRAGIYMDDSGFSDVAVDVLVPAVAAIEEAGEFEGRSALEQRALLGLAGSLLAQGDSEGAVRYATRLVERYPKSASFYDARFILGRAYRERGRIEEAITALTDVFTRASDQQLIDRATIELARIQMQAGRTKDALASCQRIVLLADPKNEATRPIYEEALAASVELQSELEQWEEVIESADLYEKHFADGPNITEVRARRGRAVVASGGTP